MKRDTRILIVDAYEINGQRYADWIDLRDSRLGVGWNIHHTDDADWQLDTQFNVCLVSSLRSHPARGFL